MLPPRPNGLQSSLFLASSDNHEPRMNSDQIRESPAESASSWPAIDAAAQMKHENQKVEDDYYEQSVTRGRSSANRISLLDIARERVDIISEQMYLLPNEYLDELKGRLRAMLEGNGSSQQRDEFMVLQRLVQRRSDLTAETLIKAHRVQLEIIVAIKSGIQFFLHQSMNLSQTALVEVFVYKRCRNIACQSQLPAEDCLCEICTNRKGFCSLCMCVICNKFDFDVNTCRWIGCDSCAHWTHTDCAIRDKQVGTGASSANGLGSAELQSRCRACNRTSELLGWVKDVFQHCAPTWDKESLLRELTVVSKIFRLSENTRGRQLFWKSEELIEKLKGGVAEAIASRSILSFLQELEMDSQKSSEAGINGRMMPPQEACSRIAEVVQEAVQKMEIVADEKMRMLKRARQALEACDHELEEKGKEVAELKLERQRKRQQIDELESVVRLKEAEADMFQLKADEARREADRLQRIALAKSGKSEEDYASSYLKQRLSEAEAERQFLFEKIKLQDQGSRSSQSNDMVDPPQALYTKIQEILKSV
ncbi:protein OBERON 2 [Nicotiana tabacum]|uniref:Protein OBERON 2 n=3 Tax=Nicotiana TaxID=4085 RepID=A0AC58S3G9_TOBAC|nr:PREDICTED: protein OBERON 2-like [Nicotiana sylvestris]XP_016455621.1 PREDICTED: protein OBERON 2-like [Nicotiana tabacum]